MTIGQHLKNKKSLQPMKYVQWSSYTQPADFTKLDAKKECSAFSEIPILGQSPLPRFIHNQCHHSNSWLLSQLEHQDDVKLRGCYSMTATMNWLKVIMAFCRAYQWWHWWRPSGHGGHWRGWCDNPSSWLQLTLQPCSVAYITVVTLIVRYVLESHDWPSITGVGSQGMPYF